MKKKKENIDPVAEALYSVVPRAEENLEEVKVIAYITRTPDGTELVSKSRHDAVYYTDTKNGLQYMTDGGTDYHHFITHEKEEDKPVNIIITVKSPFEEIRKYFFWGTRGVNGDQPLVFKPLMDLTSDHIEAILDTQKQVPEWRKQIFKAELILRQQQTL